MLIRNIWAVGRNYKDHAKELNNPVPESPLFFLKAGSTASINSPEHTLPYFVGEAHHEVELALKFSQSMKIIEAAVALDLTDRPAQNQAKQKGEPWTRAKSFHNACAVSAFFSINDLSELADLEIKLWLNDELKQSARTSDMIFSLEQLVEHALEHYPVCPGDLLLTGTPAGVGPLRQGDVVRAQIVGQITHQWRIQQSPAPDSKSATKNT